MIYIHIKRAGSDHFGSYVCSLSLHLCKRLFLGLELMITRKQLYRHARAPIQENDLYLHDGKLTDKCLFLYLL
jgi:hypothetical protein